jgi:hypothetical protein
MPARTLQPFKPFHLFVPCFLVLVSTALVTTGCGSSGNSSASQPSGSNLSGNTSVTLLLSSTANDQISEFNLNLADVTLTSQSGKTVTLFHSALAQNADFIHLNGLSAPLATLSVPQGVYTSATVTLGSTQFTCVSLDSTGGVDTSTFALTGPQSATVNLPSPITITGTAMGLSLNLQAEQSATFSNCEGGAGTTYAITPTLNIAPITIASQPTNDQNGKASGLIGRVSSVNVAGGSFNIVVDEAISGPTLAISTESGTEYQGIANLSELSAGMFVDMDTAIQSDGSLRATRLAVPDQNALNVMVGPLMSVFLSDGIVNVFGRVQQGDDFSTSPTTWSPFSFDSNTAFQTSGQFSNIQSLPFPARFSASNMVAGQNVYVSALAASYTGGQWTKATALTLMPQTINGTITGVANQGSFAEYTIALAPYDLFPDLAVQQAQNTLLADPGTVTVYVDSDTQLLNTKALAQGSTLRFNGLIFNDNGTLRMDCGQIADGVTQ